MIRTGRAVAKAVELQEKATRHGGAMRGAFDAEIDGLAPGPFGVGRERGVGGVKGPCRWPRIARGPFPGPHPFLAPTRPRLDYESTSLPGS